MRNFICGILLLLAFAASESARAAEYTHASYLLQVFPLADGTVVLIFTSDSTNCPSTANPKQYRIALGQSDVTADGVRAMQATALTAFATDTRLEIAFDNGSTNCYVNRALIRE